MGNANKYKGQIHHGEGGLPAPQGASVSKTNNVRGHTEFGKSQKAVDRTTSGKPSSGSPTPSPKVKRGSGKGSGE